MGNFVVTYLELQEIPIRFCASILPTSVTEVMRRGCQCTAADEISADTAQKNNNASGDDASDAELSLWLPAPDWKDPENNVDGSRC